ncbi:hypothetical protein PK28_16665 (plasmid) [Hymenobacter sp. DG25B]|uniref:hypothetical protein n=1 Tax=Hymenobacter sp. DG25B TaxID=1385664 RepID=UPI000540E678|nr:hypothetical protein [Hymenobacter sp. DG25B]AIZ65329.1 hypothetical protein PK28_16665 [Hymenobacter sp. DG25B]
MNPIYSLLSFLLFPLLLSAPTVSDWITYPLDERVSVQFPSEPEKEYPDKATQQPQFFMSKDSAGLYVVMRFDVSSTGRDLESTLGRKLFYASIIDGALQQEKGIFLSRTPFSTPGGAASK